MGHCCSARPHGVHGVSLTQYKSFRQDPLTYCLRTFTCISVVPVANRIVSDLEGGHESKSASVLLVTIWELGEAAGPLLIAPLSEVFGRYPVMNAANCLFLAATILAALSQSTTLFIAARALTGLAVASNVLNPAIVGDIFPSDKRGSAMSFIMLAPLLGGAIGPAISGAIAQTVGWRQVLWMSAGLAAFCEVLFLTCFRETYKVPILRNRAARLRAAMHDDSLKAPFDEGEHKSWAKLWESVMRPVIVVFSSGVLLTLSLFGSVAFAFYYIIAVTLPDVLEGLYHLTPAAAGAAFISFSKCPFLSLALLSATWTNQHSGIGSACGVVVCNRLLDRIYVDLRDSHKGVDRPEFRLPLAIVGGVTLPLAVISYGWAAHLHAPVWLVLSTVGLMGFALMLAFLPLTAYVVDAFGLYAASAMTGLIVTRCLMGTFLPLFTGPAVESLGYGWGFNVFGAATLCLIPIPVVVFRYGSKWRQLSRYTREDGP